VECEVSGTNKTSERGLKVSHSPWLWWIASIIGAAFLAAMGVGMLLRAEAGAPRAPGTEVIRTGRLEIVDSDGNPRIVLAVVDDGRPSLRLFSKDRLSIAGLMVMKSGGTRLYLCGPDSRQRASLTVDTDGSAHLSLWDEKTSRSDGLPRAGLTVQADGRACLSLADGAGKLRAGLGMSSDSHPSLVIMDENTKPVWRAP